MMVEEYTTEDFLKAMVEEALEEGREEVFELMEQGMSVKEARAYLKEKSENTAHAL